jgi:hypothetical protein
MSGATQTGGLVQAPGSGPGITSTGGPGGGVAQPEATAERPRIVIETEAHHVELSGQDLLMLSVVILLTADLVVSVAEVFR